MAFAATVKSYTKKAIPHREVIYDTLYGHPHNAIGILKEPNCLPLPVGTASSGIIRILLLLSIAKPVR